MPAQKEAEGRLSCRHPLQRTLKFLIVPAAGSGEIGAILRCHGLYSSALCEWRRQREAGTLGGLTLVKRGPKPAETNLLSAKLAAPNLENAQLWRRLGRAEAIIELQKKLAELLGLELPPVPPQIGPNSAT